MSKQGEGKGEEDPGVREVTQAEAGGITRRGFLARSAATAATAATVGSLTGAGGASAAGSESRKVPGSFGEVALQGRSRPTISGWSTWPPAPRLRKTSRICNWIEDEFVKAGLELLPTEPDPLPPLAAGQDVAAGRHHRL